MDAGARGLDESLTKAEAAKPQAPPWSRGCGPSSTLGPIGALAPWLLECVAPPLRRQHPAQPLLGLIPPIPCHMGPQTSCPPHGLQNLRGTTARRLAVAQLDRPGSVLEAAQPLALAHPLSTGRCPCAQDARERPKQCAHESLNLLTAAKPFSRIRHVSLPTPNAKAWSAGISPSSPAHKETRP